MGHRDDVPELLIILDVLSLSSRIEESSVTLLEAMAAGLRVIAADVGGNSEVVSRNQRRLIVHPCDWRGFAEAIIWMLAIPKGNDLLPQAHFEAMRFDQVMP